MLHAGRMVLKIVRLYYSLLRVFTSTEREREREQRETERDDLIVDG